MCEDCAYRPELVHCSQCRTPLFAQDGTARLTRNRALEQLAASTFPPAKGEPAGGRGRSLRTRGGRATGSSSGGGAMARYIFSPVRHMARYHFSPVRHNVLLNSDVDTDGYLM